MVTHPGWVEQVPYGIATRPNYVPGTVSGQAVDNSGTKAQFDINDTATIGVTFLADNNTNGGTAGILLGGNAFTGGDKPVSNLDTLNVTITATLASP